MIDMWYNDSVLSCDKVSIFFCDLDGEYRGNIYKSGKAIGDYSFNDWRKLEKAFPHLYFDWGA